MYVRTVVYVLDGTVITGQCCLQWSSLSFCCAGVYVLLFNLTLVLWIQW